MILYPGISYNKVPQPPQRQSAQEQAEVRYRLSSTVLPVEVKRKEIGIQQRKTK